MNIRSKLENILLFDYSNNEIVRKFFEESIIIFEEELKTKERVIEGLEYELESCREDVAELEQREVCQYDSCKFEDVCLEMEDVISNIKRR